MKNTIFGILGFLWLVGCQSDSDVISAEKFGDTFQLEPGEETQISGQSDSLKVVVQSITDGRCPQGVNCIRAGNAQVKLSLSEGGSSQAVELCIGDCHLDFDRYQGFVEQDTALVTIANQAYEVILKDVVPYLTAENSDKDQEAVLEVNLK